MESYTNGPHSDTSRSTADQLGWAITDATVGEFQPITQHREGIH